MLVLIWKQVNKEGTGIILKALFRSMATQGQMGLPTQLLIALAAEEKRQNRKNTDQI